MLVYCEAVLLLALLAGCCLGRLPGGARRRRGTRAFARLARHRRWAVALVGALALAGSAALTAVTGWPEPHYTDEFGYLLAADTFARGRLTNPTHPFWVHFENFHIIHRPSYASQYPPAQGLALAAGQVLTGRPLVGAWLSLSGACMALCWMLQGWLPPRWALFGALLLAARLVFWGHPFYPDDLRPAYWGQSYFGGAVAAGGGALVFGALRRLIERPRWTLGLVLALGLAILAGSRPYEGLACSLPAAGLLLGWLVSKNGPPWRVGLTQVVLPTGLALGVALAALAYYNYRVTGDPLTMPYQVHEHAYGSTPAFLWQPLPPRKHYNHAALEESYRGWYIREYEGQRSLVGWTALAVVKCGKILGFYAGVGLILPLVALRLVMRDRWCRFAALTCAAELAAFLAATGGLPHYIAPLTAVLGVLLIQALRQTHVARWRGLPLGRVYVRALVLAYLVLVPLSVVVEKHAGPEERHMHRARILAELNRGGGRHLVLVRYQPREYGDYHEEWVYNEADIDGARVVWAREMGRAEDAALVAHFSEQGRQVWRVDADAEAPVLEPYSGVP